MPRRSPDAKRLPARRGLLLLAATACILRGGVCSGGGPVAVSPTRLELSGESRTTDLTLRNHGESPAEFDVDVWKWTQSPEDDFRLEPTTEVSASPGTFSLLPGEEIRIRVGLTADPGEAEGTFRILVTERRPSEVSGGPGNAAGFALRLSIPIFVRPRTGPVKPTLVFSPPMLSDGVVAVTLANEGRGFDFVTKVEMAAVAGDSEVVTRETAGGYLLAGSKREHRFELPFDGCPRITGLVFRAVSEAGEVRAGFPRPDGACPASAPHVEDLRSSESNARSESTPPLNPAATRVGTFGVAMTITATPLSPREISPNGGAPLLVSKLSPTGIQVTQLQGAGGCADRSSLYLGPLAPIALATYGFSGSVCNLGIAAPLSVDIGTGSLFFVLVGTDSSRSLDGSYGRSSDGVEIPPFAAGACGTRSLGSTCP